MDFPMITGTGNPLNVSVNYVGTRSGGFGRVAVASTDGEGRWDSDFMNNYSVELG